MSAKYSIRETLSSEEVAFLIELAQQELTTKEKVISLFDTLNDPLLAMHEIADLVEQPLDEESLEVLASAISDLVDDEFLERDDETHRPLDEKVYPLFRKQGIPMQRLKLIGFQSYLAGDEKVLQFVCNGKAIRSVAQVERFNPFEGSGEQRGEISKHIRTIKESVDQNTTIPNSLLLVFDQEMTVELDFEEDVDVDASETTLVIEPKNEWYEEQDMCDPDAFIMKRPVVLHVPFRRAAFDDEKCAYLVDGQQRTAAIYWAQVAQVPITVTAFVADEDKRREIFQIANETRRVDKDVSNALLASRKGYRGADRQKKLVAEICKELCLNGDYVLGEVVEYPDQSVPKAGGVPRPVKVMKYGTLSSVVPLFTKSASIHKVTWGEVKIDEEFSAKYEADIKSYAKIIDRAFQIVKEAWPEAWKNKSPKRCLLMHQAGFWAIAKVLVVALQAGVKNQSKKGKDGLDLASDVGDREAKVWADVKKAIDNVRKQTVMDLESATAAAADDSNARRASNYMKLAGGAEVTSKEKQRIVKELLGWAKLL